MLTRLVICAAMGAMRLAELALSRQNIVRSGATVEGQLSRLTYPAMVALHVTVIGGTALLGARRRSTLWLALLLLVQPLRVWTLLTLGTRWNTRGAVPVDITVATGGPYRFVRHPNYAVVFVELLALPAAFGLRRLALVGMAVNAALLAIRIHDEEAALRDVAGYEAQFAGRKRFIPGLF